MHKLLMNRFLGTTSLLLGPNDPPNGGEGAQDQGGADDTSGEGADGATSQDENGGASDDTGSDAGDDEADDDSDSTGDDDEEDELAGLTPEQRAKVEARLARETGWRDRQIDRLHAKRRSAEEDVQAAATIVQRQPGADLTPTQVEERARELAKTMTAQATYDEACNAAFAQGKSLFSSKWDGALAKLPKLGGVEIPDMQNIMATEQPHVVLYQLSNPDTYERVMSLPPAKRFAEFVKLSLKQFPKPASKTDSKRPGDAPPPPRPLDSTGRRVAAKSVDLHNDNVDDAAWYAERNRTRRKKFSNVD